MAQKIQTFCNRCGKDIYNDSGCYAPTSFLRNYSAKITYWGVGEPRSSFGQRIDLCPDCDAEFVKFLEGSVQG